MFLGFFSYGLSIVLFVMAMRSLGSARTSAFFGTAPFIGAILSFLIYGTLPDTMFLIALPILIFGAAMLLKDVLDHSHIHGPVIHEHRHTHTDGHHYHAHENTVASADIPHSHVHEHKALEHSHQHMPDIHHRHNHK